MLDFRLDRRFFRERHTASKKIKELLEEAIIVCKIKPGARLIEEEIATELGVSRSPVREAILALEREGLAIRKNNQKGRIVAALNIEEITELYDLWAILGGGGAQLLSQNPPERFFKLADRILQRMKNVVKNSETEDSVREYRDLNYKFHESFVEFCGNNRLFEAYKIVTKQVRWCQNLTIAPQDISQSLKDHLEIYDTLKSRPEDLERIVREHLSEAGKRLRNAYRAATHHG